MLRLQVRPVDTWYFLANEKQDPRVAPNTSSQGPLSAASHRARSSIPTQRHYGPHPTREPRLRTEQHSEHEIGGHGERNQV